MGDQTKIISKYQALKLVGTTTNDQHFTFLKLKSSFGCLCGIWNKTQNESMTSWAKYYILFLLVSFKQQMHNGGSQKPNLALWRQ